MKVEHSHVRILREGLAGLYKLQNPFIQKRVLAVLTAYGMAVGPYCECPEKARNHTGILTCLDCGKTFPEKEGA